MRPFSYIRYYLAGFCSITDELLTSLTRPPGDNPKSDSEPDGSGLDISATTYKQSNVFFLKKCMF